MNARRARNAIAAGLVLAALLTARAAWPEPVKLRMANWNPTNAGGPYETLVMWSEKVAKASGNTLLISVDRAALAKPTGQYELARDGIVDFAYMVLQYTPGRFTIARGGELPFMFPDAAIGSAALWDWYAEHVGDKEFHDTKLITMWVHEPGVIHTSRPVARLSDLERIKLRVGGGGVEIAKALGATPVAMPVTKAQEALRRRVVEGTLLPFDAVTGLKLLPLLEHHLEAPGGLYTSPMALVMNKKRYDALSDEHRALLAELGGLNGAEFIGKRFKDGALVAREAAIAQSHTITKLTGADFEQATQMVSGIVNAWIAKANELGYDGAALVDSLRQSVRKYQAP